MNKQQLLFFIIIGLFGIFINTACNKLDGLDDLEVVNYDAEFAIPLFSGEASFQDVLKNFDEETFITILPDGLIQLNYKGNVLARSSDEIFELLDDINGLPLPIVDTVVGLEFDLPNNIDVDLAILKTGRVKWLYQSEHNEPLIVRVTIPNAIKDGEIFSVTKEHTAATNTWINPEIDVAGYTLYPTNDSIFVHYQAYRPDVGYADTLSNFFFQFLDLKASYIEGYLGNELYELPRDTIEIEFFENWTRGDVYFEDPKILVAVENSFGFPVRSKANVLSILTANGDSLGLESDFIELGIDFEYPSLNEVGVTSITNFYFDKNNSNIQEILGSNPVSVDYDFDAFPNPDSDTTIRGFMTDSSAFKVEVEVELPIYGSATEFIGRDTFDVNFDEYDQIGQAEFKFVADNGIPVTVGMQAYFADAAGNILDSLFVPSQNILEAALVDSEGLVTQRTENVTFSTFDSERFKNIKTAKYLYLTAAFSTSNEGADLVKIFSDQDVQFRMGMKIGIEEQ